MAERSRDRIQWSRDRDRTYSSTDGATFQQVLSVQLPETPWHLHTICILWLAIWKQKFDWLYLREDLWFLNIWILGSKKKRKWFFSMHFGVNLLFIFRLNPDVFSKFSYLGWTTRLFEFSIFMFNSVNIWIFHIKMYTEDFWFLNIWILGSKKKRKWKFFLRHIFG